MKIFFTIIILELFIGGGGRLIDIGPMSLRMILFILCILLSIAMVIRSGLVPARVVPAVYFLTAYLAIYLVGSIIGAFNNNSINLIRSDIQQSLYWFAAPFFALTLSLNHIKYIGNLAILSGLILSLLYLFTILGLSVGIIDFYNFYKKVNSTEEFMFRSDVFFSYKGFIYIGIAIIFTIALRPKYYKIVLIILASALIMTLTRGFLISTFAAMLLMLISLKSWSKLASITITILMALIIYIYITDITATDMVTSREISNNQRIEDMSYIIQNIDASTLIFGSGLGSTINNRMNIENTFLWALWKLGFLGFIFWISPLIAGIKYFLIAKKNQAHYMIAHAYFYGLILIYIQTLSNPYLNNPIGLSFVIISIFSLRLLAYSKKLN